METRKSFRRGNLQLKTFGAGHMEKGPGEILIEAWNEVKPLSNYEQYSSPNSTLPRNYCHYHTPPGASILLPWNVLKRINNTHGVDVDFFRIVISQSPDLHREQRHYPTK